MNTNLHTRVSVLMLWKENIFSLHPMKIIRNLSFVPERKRIEENISRGDLMYTNYEALEVLQKVFEIIMQEDDFKIISKTLGE